MNKLVTIIIAIYMACGAIAYGHVYVYGEKTVVGVDGQRRERDPLDRSFTALFSAALWPLYGSIVYWEKQQ